MGFFFEHDNLCIDLGGGNVVKNITAYVEYAGEHYDTILIKSGKWQVTGKDGKLIATDSIFTIEVCMHTNYALIKGKFRVTEKIGPIVNFCFFKGQFDDTEFGKAFINKGMEFNGVVTDHMCSTVSVEALTVNECQCSVDFAIGINGHKCIVAGAVNYSDEFSSVQLCANGGISLITPMFYTRKQVGEISISNDFVLARTDNLSNALELYIDSVADNNGGSPVKAPAYSGWCSWYYYGPNISEQIIKDNMAELKKRSVNVDIIQIDDGWNKNRGDWEANNNFPGGMKKLAEEIKSEGFIPGIWVSPLTAASDSDFFQNNQDIFVKSFDCDEVYGSNTIDFSTEKAQKYLYDLFHKLSYEWGYRYIKFDFVIYGISAGRHSVNGFNGVKNYRKALEIMRSAVTEDTLLLACTSPLSQAVNYVHFIRTSMDIFEQWSSLKTVAKQVLLREFMNKHIRIDPDCVMIRTSENEDGEAFRLCTRTVKETETLVSFIASTGGNIMFSDKVMLLSNRQTDIYKRMLPVNQVAGKALDLGIRDIPSEIIVDGGDIRAVFLFNWEDYPQKLEVDLDESCNAFDFWERKNLGSVKKLLFTIAPHECKVLHCSNKSLLGFYDRIAPNYQVEETADSLILKGLKIGEMILFDTSREIQSVTGGEVCDGVFTAAENEAVIIYK